MCIRYLHSFLCCHRDCGTEIGHENRDVYCRSAERAGVFGQCAGGAAIVGELEHYGREACERCKSRVDYVSPPPETETVTRRGEDGNGGRGRGVDEELAVEERERVERLEPEQPDELEARQEKEKQEQEKLEMEKLEKEKQKPRGRVKTPPSPPVGRASAIKIDTTKKWSGPPIFEFAFETALKEQVEEFHKRSSVRKRKSSPDVADENDGPEWLEVESPTKPSPRRVSKKAKRDGQSNNDRPSFDQYGF